MDECDFLRISISSICVTTRYYGPSGAVLGALHAQPEVLLMAFERLNSYRIFDDQRVMVMLSRRDL